MKNSDCRYDIDRLAAELDIDMASIAELYSSYFSEMKEETAAMESFLAKNDWYMLERVVHNVKGVSANLNVSDVFEEARILDEMLKKNISDNAEHHVEKIIKRLLDSELEIRKYFMERNIPI